MRNVLLHEIQHAIQVREDFLPGSDFDKKAYDEGDSVEKYRIWKNYDRIGGEVEARLVEKRSNMSAEERKQTPPWKSLDIPELLLKL